jgi:hypothetical protein
VKFCDGLSCPHIDMKVAILSGLVGLGVDYSGEGMESQNHLN